MIINSCGREGKNLSKKLLAIIFAAVMFISSVIPSAAAATDTYTRADVKGNDFEYRLSREMYTAKKEITASSLGLSQALEGLTDVCFCEDGTILVLCGEKSRLIKINSDYTLNSVMEITQSDGNTVDFTGAKGVYSAKNGDIYIADTLNARIIIADASGRVNSILGLPESKLIPEGFLYQPTAIAKDKEGYTYILSFGCFYGALLYSPEYEFLGFYGANTVKSGALDTLNYLWDKLTGNDEKKSADVKTLPYSFVDFDFDSDGYLVTCTGNTEGSENGEGQIRKISPTGADILYKRKLSGDTVTSSAVNFLEKQLVLRRDMTGAYVAQNIVSTAVSSDNYIFALDRTNGTVYIYDSECNLMSAFGGGIGTGEQLGVFKAPVALAVNDNAILVADQEGNAVTVFEPTEYGALLRAAQSLYLKGDYEEAKDLWKRVLSYDRGSQPAYRGLAMAYYNEGNYKEALKAARIAVDYTVYDLAWQAILSDFFAKNFIWLAALAILAAAAIVTGAVKLKKSGFKIKNPRIKIVLGAPLHPFRSFEEMKYKGLASYKISVVITVLLFVAFALKKTAAGFLYTNVTARNYNIIYTFASTAGLLLLWSFANWLVCSIFSGKGTFKEVYAATAYSLTPIIIYTFIYTLVSRFATLSSSGLLNGIGTAVALYSAFIMCVAIIEVHEFDFTKTLLTAAVTVFFMILIVFVIFMCAILLKQLGTFIYSVYSETAYR